MLENFRGLRPRTPSPQPYGSRMVPESVYHTVRIHTVCIPYGRMGIAAALPPSHLSCQLHRMASSPRAGSIGKNHAWPDACPSRNPHAYAHALRTAIGEMVHTNSHIHTCGARARAGVCCMKRVRVSRTADSAICSHTRLDVVEFLSVLNIACDSSSSAPLRRSQVLRALLHSGYPRLTCRAIETSCRSGSPSSMACSA